MKKILIIKAGTTYDSIREKYGDFEDYIINTADLNYEDILVWNAYQKEKEPDINDVSAIIITGSHSMVSDFEDWSVMLSKWLKDTASGKVPILGICYGHQLLAQTFGGTVGYHPRGKEFGTVYIELTEDGEKDPLLGVLPEKFFGHVAHSQTAIKVPPEALVLAGNEFEPHHAFALKNNIWGVQFHPEFTMDITHSYIEKLEDSLKIEGYDIKALKSSLQDNDYGKILLKRFIELI
ncbi:GMP synthase [Oxobacter pfennigii]|uniref:GMP synthase n=1 Tax=Oxobacter pfennigii TaxID=36849 RepID=A0A0P8YEY9_9CLOT|nr:glutamine amidotransferase [Oxobacter pfennigii]KPU45730.1 GMP synthase [Oxobacter pfennigii]